MSTTISLHHVGEVVLAALLDGLARSDRLGAVPCKLHPDCSLLTTLGGASITPPYSFAVNAKLAPVAIDGQTVGFDGAHGVDVLCHGGGRGLPIEAKLGLDRVTAAAFGDRFLQPLTMSGHDPPRCNGSMTAILSFRHIGDGAPLPLRTAAPATVLSASWLLVVREKTWAKWRPPPALGTAHVVLFEDVARAHGDGAAFDRVVRGVVGDGFHSAWEVFS